MNYIFNDRKFSTTKQGERWIVRDVDYDGVIGVFSRRADGFYGQTHGRHTLGNCFRTIRGMVEYLTRVPDPKAQEEADR